MIHTIQWNMIHTRNLPSFPLLVQSKEIFASFFLGNVTQSTLPLTLKSLTNSQLFKSMIKLCSKYIAVNNFWKQDVTHTHGVITFIFCPQLQKTNLFQIGFFILDCSNVELSKIWNTPFILVFFASGSIDNNIRARFVSFIFLPTAGSRSPHFLEYCLKLDLRCYLSLSSPGFQKLSN